MHAVTAFLLLSPVAGCGGDDDDSGDAADDASATSVDRLPDWPAPDNPIELIEAAGLEPADREFLATHRHSHLDVFVDGEEVEVPAGIGIDITDPGVQHGRGPSYGGIQQCTNPCISPLHTHDGSGVLHTEAQEDHLLTLGQFFTEWGVVLEDGCVGEFCAPDTDIAVYVDGELVDGDPADIELDDQVEIAVVIGTPPDEIPSSGDFSGA